MTTTATKTSTAYKTWVSRIESGTMSKSQCQQFARVAVLQAEGYEARGHRTNLTADEATLLVDLIQARGGVTLTDEHTKQGIEWLERYGHKKLGLPDAVLGETPFEGLRFSYFTFDGIAHIMDNGYTAFAIPVWTIHLVNGDRIRYYCNAWQAWDESNWWWVR